MLVNLLSPIWPSAWCRWRAWRYRRHVRHTDDAIVDDRTKWKRILGWGAVLGSRADTFGTSATSDTARDRRMILSIKQVAIGIVLLAALPLWWWVESKTRM